MQIRFADAHNGVQFELTLVDFIILEVFVHSVIILSDPAMCNLSQKHAGQ